MCPHQHINICKLRLLLYIKNTVSDLEWKMIYVGSAESEEYDQVLDTIYVGPIPEGRHMFVFQVRSNCLLNYFLVQFTNLFIDEKVHIEMGSCVFFIINWYKYCAAFCSILVFR